jgi:signal transduction histidine kinase
MMARELHDIVSHAVSVIAVQAGAAELSWPIDPPTARRAMDVVGTVAEQTVAELDRLLPGRTSVSHDVADLRALVDRMRAAGLDVTLDLPDKTSSPVPETVYRVVQEALTNALRHAPGSRVRVRIDRTADLITIRVADDGPGSAADSRRGYGLIGLAERLRQAGGTLATCSTPGVPGFEVTAMLPHQAVIGTP